MFTKRWQDWSNGVLGAWLLVAPWILAFATSGAAARTAWVLGAALIIVAILAAYLPRMWDETIDVVLGVYLFISPWVMNYADRTRATANALVVGLMVIALATRTILIDTAIQKWWRERHP